MSDVENLLKTAVSEMEKMLASKTVIGEPIKVGEKTVVPLLSVGAGFGAGAGRGNGEEGSGGGAAGGFGMKPVAVIVIEKNDVRVEPIRESAASLAEALVAKVPSLIKDHMQEKGKGKEKKKTEIKVE